MQKYLDGRIKAYSHLFTEISPPVPKEYADGFRVNNQILPGYTIEGEEPKPPGLTVQTARSEEPRPPAPATDIGGEFISKSTTQPGKEIEPMQEPLNIQLLTHEMRENKNMDGAWLKLPATAELGAHYLKNNLMITMPENWKHAVNTELLGTLIATDEPGKFCVKGYVSPAAAANTPDITGTPSVNSTFSIYQLKSGDETRGIRFEPLEALEMAGVSPNIADYNNVYTAPLKHGDSLERIHVDFIVNRPEGFTGHSLSVSDIVVMNREGLNTRKIKRILTEPPGCGTL